MIRIPQNLCIDLTDEQASTVQGGKKLRIKSITALKAGSDPGSNPTDDVYALIDGERKSLGAFQTGTSKQLDIVREVGQVGVVRLFDNDGNKSSDDPLGSLRVDKSIKDGRLEIFGSNSKYEVFYSLGFG